MGGKVLQLESERLLELGEARGKIIGKAIGKAEGETIGMMRGEARIRALINCLISDGRADEIQKVINNAEMCGELYRKYGL